MPILKAFTTAVIAALSLSVAAAPAQENNSQNNKYIIILKGGISSRDVESHVIWARGIHDASLGRRALDLPGIEQRYDFGDFTLIWGHLMKRLFGKSWTTQIRTSGPQPYRYDDSAGENTFAYVLDTGVNDKHVEFGGRAILGYSAFEADFPNNPHEDRSGPRTMVADIIASNTYGVAKKTNIVAVQTDQTTSGTLGAIAWAVRDIQRKGRVGQAVMDYSGGLESVPESAGLGYQPGVALARSMDIAFNEGILCVIAAGNDGQVVEQSSSPYQGNSTTAFVVGAINQQWNFMRLSNHGPSVDILAPGENVMTITRGSDTATTVQSGTSFAAPHVAGLALYLIAAEKIKTTAELRARILALATKDKITNVPANTVNLLAFNGVQ
ncbi:Subtilisin-like serine protease PR1J [Metarhizium guizhouense ARSEF 977]|uniref:Subtilisin-like serine protease PR1J n=1 Tax=Metarhizium guizhouense (strain ARSEF 977) TaxID=1276136 RepID=A0A0B4GFX7_METGA|nr:Subtilisin-like serine protease PR1J [Metarhizium guizhouense ARSEF 977]